MQNYENFHKPLYKYVSSMIIIYVYNEFCRKLICGYIIISNKLLLVNDIMFENTLLLSRLFQQNDSLFGQLHQIFNPPHQHHSLIAFSTYTY